MNSVAHDEASFGNLQVAMLLRETAEKLTALAKEDEDESSMLEITVPEGTACQIANMASDIGLIAEHNTEDTPEGETVCSWDIGTESDILLRVIWR
jgi:hypothetical protein